MMLSPIREDSSISYGSSRESTFVILSNIMQENNNYCLILDITIWFLAPTTLLLTIFWSNYMIIAFTMIMGIILMRTIMVCQRCHDEESMPPNSVATIPNRDIILFV